MTEKYYTFQRYNMVIEYDATVGNKVTQSYLDSDTLKTFTSTTTSEEDFPIWKNDIQFVPYYGSFVYVVKNYLWFKHDPDYDITEDSFYMMNQDPCLRGSHLFSGDNLESYSVRYSTGANYKVENNLASSMEYAFDSLWIIMRGN